MARAIEAPSEVLPTGRSYKARIAPSRSRRTKSRFTCSIWPFHAAFGAEPAHRQKLISALLCLSIHMIFIKHFAGVRNIEIVVGKRRPRQVDKQSR